MIRQEIKWSYKFKVTEHQNQFWEIIKI